MQAVNIPGGMEQPLGRKRYKRVPRTLGTETILKISKRQTVPLRVGRHTVKVSSVKH